MKKYMNFFVLTILSATSSMFALDTADRTAASSMSTLDTADRTATSSMPTLDTAGKTATSSKPTLDAADRNAITQIIEHFTNAWNNNKAQGSAKFYAEDADFVNIYGMAFAGKQAIEARHVLTLETFLKGSTFEVLNSRLREVKPGLVIAHVYWKVSNIKHPEVDAINGTMKGIFTHVFLKNNGKWEIVATQNTQIRD